MWTAKLLERIVRLRHGGAADPGITSSLSATSNTSSEVTSSTSSSEEPHEQRIWKSRAKHLLSTENIAGKLLHVFIESDKVTDSRAVEIPDDDFLTSTIKFSRSGDLEVATLALNVLLSDSFREFAWCISLSADNIT
jgi:hypothetical protein